MGFEQDFKKMLNDAIGVQFKNASDLAAKAGVSQSSLSFFLSGARKNLSLESVAKLIDCIGGKTISPTDDPTREVVFVNPRLHESYNGLPAPAPDDYRAIPLTNMEVAAGPGINIQEELELKSWVLVYTQELALRSVRLVAARVGKNQKSMLPSIQPGDIVVIDLDDKDIKRPGIFLVRDPDEGAALKRVKYFTKRGQPFISFYSDNAADGYEPATYTLDEFDPDQSRAIDKAIVGRCIWQWGDLENR